MNTEELKRLAEAATPGPWVAAINTNMDNKVCHSFGDICQTGKDIGDAIFIAAANPAAILELIRQRDELLAAMKDAREMVSDWAGYASPYFQEKHDIDGDLKKLDAAITKAEG